MKFELMYMQAGLFEGIKVFLAGEGRRHLDCSQIDEAYGKDYCAAVAAAFAPSNPAASTPDRAVLARLPLGRDLGKWIDSHSRGSMTTAHALRSPRRAGARLDSALRLESSNRH